MKVISIKGDACVSIFKCVVCGKLFDRVGNGVYCPGPHYRPCPVCGKPVEFRRPKEPVRCCSKECVNKKALESKRKNLGMRKCKICGKEYQPNDFSQKYCSGPHETKCIICGKTIVYTCHPSDKPNTCSEECKEALRMRTNVEHYGCSNPATNDEIRKKISYAKKHPKIKLEPIVEESIAVETISSVPDGFICDGPAKDSVVIVRNANDLEVQQFVESFNICAKYSKFTTDTCSFSCISIPRYNLCVMFVPSNDIVDSTERSSRFRFLQNLGYRLLIIDEYDWISHNNIVKSTVRDFIGRHNVYDRTKYLRAIDLAEDDAESFYSDNHLGSFLQADLYLGLVSETGDIRFAVALTKVSDYEWNLLWITKHINVCVTNGLYKILNYFSRYHQATKIVYSINPDDVSYTWCKNLGFIENSSTEFGNSVLELNPTSVFRTKTCVLCGKKFIPKLSSQRVCYDDHYRNCKFCGKKFRIYRHKDSQQCCSIDCTVKLRESTMVERFNVPHPFKSQELWERYRKSSLNHYGVDHPMKSDEVKDKVASTNLSRFGVSTPFLMDGFKDKAYNTCMQKYGVPDTGKIPERIDKTKKTNLERYGSIYPLGNPEIFNRAMNTMLERFGVPLYCMSSEYKSINRQIISKVNISFRDMLSYIGVQSSLDDVSIDRYSYDLHIESSNILIEINPTVTHNVVKNPWGSSRIVPTYHADKTFLAKSHGYRCINVWDWDVYDKIINMLQPKTKVYARNCEIHIVSSDDADAFENFYHLQNAATDRSFCAGLFYDGELVQIMSLSKISDTDWELSRFCTKFGVSVLGGVTKLWKYFIKSVNPKSVTSRCDISKFSGDIYELLGMNLDVVTDPQKIWSKSSNYILDYDLQAFGVESIFGDTLESQTVDEYMLSNHWLPVYDCGYAIYSYHNN